MIIVTNLMHSEEVCVHLISKMENQCLIMSFLTTLLFFNPSLNGQKGPLSHLQELNRSFRKLQRRFKNVPIERKNHAYIEFCLEATFIDYALSKGTCYV